MYKRNLRSIEHLVRLNKELKKKPVKQLRSRRDKTTAVRDSSQRLLSETEKTVRQSLKKIDPILCLLPNLCIVQLGNIYGI